MGNYFSECAAPNSCGALRPNGQNSPKSGPEYSVLMILTIYAKTHCTHGDYGVHELTVVSLCLYSRLCSHHPRICLSGLRHSPSRSITASLTMLRHARRPAVRGGGGSSSTAAVNIKGNDVARMPFGRRLLQTVQHPDKFLIATYQYNALTHSRQCPFWVTRSQEGHSNLPYSSPADYLILPKYGLTHSHFTHQSSIKTDQNKRI